MVAVVKRRPQSKMKTLSISYWWPVRTIPFCASLIAAALYWLKVYQLPLASRQARGKPIVNLLPLEENERITAILPVREYEEGKFVFMATANGTVKKLR